MIEQKIQSLEIRHLVFPTAISMDLQNFFRQTETNASTHTWILVAHDPTKSPVEDLARELAERIVGFQCRGASHYCDVWKAKATSNVPLSNSAETALRAFLVGVFGLPGDYESIPQDHLEGYVGQMLWYFICDERKVIDSIQRIEPPGFKSTDAGGDGLVIHHPPNSELMFRLWEMKKYVPRSSQVTSAVSSTVNTAYKQLDSKALEYLARYTAIGQELSDDELKDFYGKLVDLWVDASPQASAGVSVTTSASHVPTRCFGTFGTHFPRFTDPVRLRGMLTAIDDFATFCRKVQEEVWKGL